MLVIALIIYYLIPNEKPLSNADNRAILHLQQIQSSQINEYLGANHTTITMTDSSIVIEVVFETDIQVSDKEKENIINYIQKSMNTEDKLIEIRTVH